MIYQFIDLKKKHNYIISLLHKHIRSVNRYLIYMIYHIDLKKHLKSVIILNKYIKKCK